MEMVSVGKFYLTLNSFKILCGKSTLDCPLSTYIHKYRGLNFAVRSIKLSPSGMPFLI
jgi:hypothetical protein